ncbi:hypothetical protein IAR55_001646 [Kwoniella newhampshirensis]|uniref:HhH-GPD domain-containing protein n=1 Tax=Kwoniella newhampshirensis TaxID=1651941 RepID=A0AAW0Z2P5_9TREE
MLRALDLLGRYYLHSHLIRDPTNSSSSSSSFSNTGSSDFILASISKSPSVNARPPSGLHVDTACLSEDENSDSGSDNDPIRVRSIGQSGSTSISSDRGVVVSPYFALKTRKMSKRCSRRANDTEGENKETDAVLEKEASMNDSSSNGEAVQSRGKRSDLTVGQAGPSSPPITPLSKRTSRKASAQHALSTPESLPRPTKTRRRMITKRKRKRSLGDDNVGEQPNGERVDHSVYEGEVTTEERIPSLRKGRRKELVVEIPTSVGTVHGNEEKGEKVVTRDEKGIVEPVGKIHLIQERLRHDPWKILVATSLLNVTSGKQARPVLAVLLKRWPTPQIMAEASITDLSQLLYPLGLYNQRASSLVRFSRQYLDLGWPLITPTLFMDGFPPLPAELDVKVFHGAGVYASDSFRIFSPLLPGKGGPEYEGKWLSKRSRALERITANSKVGNDDLGEGDGEAEDLGVEQVAEWMSDDDLDDDDEKGGEEEEWRTVRPKDKELRRYLIWRWGIEGIVYDITTGPKIVQERDQRRLRVLTDES